MNNIKTIFSRIRKKQKMFIGVISLVITQFLFIGSMSNVLAQEDEVFIYMPQIYGEQYNATVITSGDTAFAGTATGSSSVGSLHFLGLGMFGSDSFEDLSYKSGVEDLTVSEDTKKGLLNTLDGEVNALLYNPPGVNIPAHLANQWVPGYATNNSTLAADTGYSHLKGLGIEGVWEMFRNIAYLGFVLILVATGFMIMFRTKIGGQTAVTVMNSLPSILIGLVLVTFSFAIVGFAIDLSRLLSAVIENLLIRSLSDYDITPLAGPMQMASWAFGAAEEATWSNVLNTNALDVGLITAIRNIIVNEITSVFKFVLVLIYGFVALYAAVKLFVSLVMAYVKILMELFLGPIHILVGSLPGGSHSIVNWIKRVLSNALVFPIAFFIVNIFRYIGRPDINNPITSNFSGFMSGGEEIGDSFIQLKGAIILAGYFIAAGASGIVEDLFQLKEGPGTAKAMGNVQKSASEIPFLGSLFKG